MSGAVQVAARLLAERTGMQLSDGLRERLAGCLEAAARAGGQAPERYAAALAADADAFQALLDCVTVQETGFFRHHDQFAALEREVLPALQGPVSVWSAGCANGQEAYSLAMVLAASGHADWQVLATDISYGAVARARAGRYSTEELAGLPPAHRHWLRPAGGGLWEIDPALRRRVRVERANLTDRFPLAPATCQVVFCRNVLIYLARPVALAFLDRLGRWLAPGGTVFLGYSETMLGPTDRLRVERLGDAYVLRSVPEGGGSRPAGPGGRVAGSGRAPRPVGSGPHRPGSGARPPAPPGAEGAVPADRSQEAVAMAAAGEAAAARGDPGAAVTAFRKAVFLDPDQPGAWFQLGLALEAVPDPRGARRAYAAALAALERCDPGAVQRGLDGWPADELAGVLRARLERPAAMAPPLRLPGPGP